MDFGFASAAASSQILSSSSARGKPSNRAHELLQLGTGKYSQKPDIWALGCIVFEMVTGRKRFDGDWEVHEFARDEEFRIILFISMLTTSGLVARPPEMTMLKYMNTSEADRNVFVLNGQIMFVMDYIKTQAVTMTQKVLRTMLHR